MWINRPRALALILTLLSPTLASANGFHGFGVLLMALFLGAPAALLMLIFLFITLWMRCHPKPSRKRQIFALVIRALALGVPAGLIFGSLILENWRLVGDVEFLIFGLVGAFCLIGLPTAYLSRGLGAAD
ncbi:hypothetical protein KKB55_01725 [Myxococcota bacterium]|nr:hypothetical protein [Myxococcota bacterium]MBU1896472.1 hypothetical protein [Myxococcota bacterium]